MNKIKELRLLKGLTREELARYVDINASNIAKFENGNRKLTVANAAKIAEYFNVSVEELLGENVNLKNFVYHFVVEFAHEPSPMEAIQEIMLQLLQRTFDDVHGASSKWTLTDARFYAMCERLFNADTTWNENELMLINSFLDALTKKAGK